MINKILVPLDGSKLAECALPYAEEMAEKLGSEVALITVTSRTQGFFADEDGGGGFGERSQVRGDPYSNYEKGTNQRFIPEAVCTMEEKAGQYLDKLAKGMESKGIKVLKEVVCGKAAEEIIVYADTRRVNLIVMSSHGRKGPSQLFRGSVAQKVMKGSTIPVMLIRAPGCTL